MADRIQHHSRSRVSKALREAAFTSCLIDQRSTEASHPEQQVERIQQAAQTPHGVLPSHPDRSTGSGSPEPAASP